MSVFNLEGRTLEQAVAAFYNFDYSPTVRHEVIDIHIGPSRAGTRTGYLAVRRTDRVSGRTCVVACVPTIDDQHRMGWDGHLRGWDEFAGPVEAECPQRILDVLSPMEGIVGFWPINGDVAWAVAWRRRCHEALVTA